MNDPIEFGGRTDQAHSIPAVYCGAEFDRLVELVTGYFTQSMCVNGSEERLMRVGVEWSVSEQQGMLEAWTIIYRSRFELQLPNAGIVVKVKNLRQLGDRVELRPRIREQFGEPPNVVEFEARKGYPDNEFILACRVAEYINQHDSPAFLETCDQQFGRLSYDESLPVVERFERVVDRAHWFLADKTEGEAALRGYFGVLWDQLTVPVRQSLVSGISLLQLQREYRELILDFATIAICFCRAVEQVLHERVMLPFRELFRASGHRLSNAEMRGSARFVANFLAGKSDGLEVGKLAYFLEKVLPDAEQTQAWASCQAFHQFASTRARPDFLLNPEKLARELAEFNREFRRKVAHRESIPFDLIDQLLDFLMNDPRRFLPELVAASGQRE